MFLFFLVTQVVTDFSRIQHFISLLFLFISCFCALKIITHRNISITATLHICILVCFIIFFFYVHLQRDFFLSLNTTARNLLHYFPLLLLLLLFFNYTWNNFMRTTSKKLITKTKRTQKNITGATRNVSPLYSQKICCIIRCTH